MVEQWSPKPKVESSILSTRAKHNEKNMKLFTYIEESYTELVKKVTWPTWSELQNSAVVVMIASLIIAIIIALMDSSFKNIMQLIYSVFY